MNKIMAEVILVITNFPDKKSATSLAEKLVDEQVAACVNIFGECKSIYRWHNKPESADEIPVFIKTQQTHYSQVERTIKAMHPYELPEVIVVPVNGGYPAYMQWIIDETSRKN